MAVVYIHIDDEDLDAIMAKLKSLPYYDEMVITIMHNTEELLKDENATHIDLRSEAKKASKEGNTDSPPVIPSE